MQYLISFNSQKELNGESCNSVLLQVNVSVKVKERGSGALPASGGTRSCVAVCVMQTVPGINP